MLKSFQKEEKLVSWNTNKKDGWKNYLETTTNNEMLDDLAKNADMLDSTQIMSRMSRFLNRIKLESFGKVKVSHSSESNRRLEELYKLKTYAIKIDDEPEANKIENQIREELLIQQRKDFEKKLKCLDEIKKKKGNSSAIFKLKEQLLGSKKAGPEAVSMEDPRTGLMIVEKKKLKEASVNYVSNLLTNRLPKEEYQQEFQAMENLHDLRIAENENNDEELTKDDFEDFLKQMTKKNKDKYQFILKAGNSYQNLLFELYKKVWKTETKPTSWKKTLCHQLYKGKGEKKDFCNQRFIHTKEDVPKGFEQIVINKSKPHMVQNCTKFQIGAIPGHQPAEHLFTIKSIISFFRSSNRPLFLQCFDIKKYFDSENLKDAMNTIYNYGVKGKLYNLIYELNKSSQIKIKTSVGVTDSFEVGPTVAQGSIGGGLISSCNLDFTLNKYFKNSSSEIFYHDLRLQPLVYQDDLGRFSDSIISAQDGARKIESCMESKLLDLHSDKSCFLIIGNQSQRKIAQKELKVNPILLYGRPMKEKQKEKYLGDFIHSDGNAASAEATVSDRYGRILVGAFEIRQIVENSQSLIIGGIKAGMHLWETAYIPSLLNNCQTWVEVSEDTVDKLEELQNKFFRSILSVPRTTPKAALIWEMGGLKMKWRIAEKKLVFMNQILHQNPGSLARQVQQIQESENLPGLTEEVKGQVEKLNLPNPFEECIPQNKWKSLVKASIKEENEKEVKTALSSYKKLKNRKILEESLGMKNYMETLSVYEARAIFKHKTSMTQFVKLNYKGTKRYQEQGWKCDECSNLDSEDHLLWCSGYELLRENLDLENEKDLSRYLQKIFLKRCPKKG